ncbi:MAG: DUF3347 domain-containing protein [Chitinophagaceae bacterium]|nr:DUF3347 domain-containing protein [Chitinophagaceae bacterium]
MDIKQILTLLSIALPAFIILLGIARLFVKSVKWINGFTMFSAFILLLAGIARYLFFPSGGSSSDNGPKPVPLNVSKHSEVFNRSAESVLSSYLALTDAFVNNDTTAIGKAGSQFKLSLDSFKVDELKVDSIIYQTALQPYENVKSETSSVIADPSIKEKRGSFNILSNELFSLLSTVRYDLSKLYWHECEKAFGDGNPGNWLSKNEEEKTNPYGVEDCAELKTTIDFIPVADTSQSADTTKTK